MSAGYFDKAVRLSFGQVAAGAAIEVRHTGGGLADIYSNAAMTTPLSNPGVLGDDGRYEFYALFGVYNITVGAGASAATYRFKLDGDGVNFLTRADFVSAVVNGYAPDGGTVVAIGGLSWGVIPVGHADYGTDPISDLPGWMPVGDVYADHWGASVYADGATNHSAIQAALNSKYGTINIQTTGTYNVSGQLRYTGYSKMLQGAGAELASISFSDDFDGSCILFEPSDPLDNSYRSGNGIANIILSGNASTRLNRWAIDVRKQEVFRLDNVRWGGFSFGLQVAGGQLSSFSRFYGFGSGLLPGAELAGSTQIKITDAENTSGAQKNYTCTFSQFVIGGSSNKNISDVITLEQADGASFSDGYVSFGKNSLVKLAQSSGNAVTATMFSNVYFDGVSTSTGTDHFITAVDDSLVGQATLEFSSCFIGNYSDDIFDLNVNNNIQSLKFNGCNISTSATGLGVIKGQTSATAGLRFVASGTSFRNAPTGLTINGAQSVNIDAQFSSMSDATASLYLSGVMREKKLSVSYTNCAASISDTSSGTSEYPEYEWQDEGVFTPELKIGGSSAGIVHDNQIGEYIVFGRMVQFSLYVKISSKGALSGNVTISGLPKTIAGTLGPEFSSVRTGSTTVISTVSEVSADSFAGTDIIRMSKKSSNGKTTLTESDILSTAEFSITGAYRWR